MDKTYVIKHASGTYWSGKRWVSEYPDALVFDDYAKARSAFKLCEARANLRDNEAWLVEDYGTFNERIVLTSAGA
jgi:hypothetical protein